MPADAVRQLVYASSTCVLLDAEALADILRVSRRNNAAQGVTGALVYAGGNVMQVLEGAPEAVEAVYRRVAADPRHRRILVLLDRPAVARDFSDWAMGLVRPEELPDAARAEIRSLYEMTEPAPGFARRLLASFRALAPEARPHPPVG